MSSEIQHYWDERAKSSGGDVNGTTNDIHLRVLEWRTLATTLEDMGLTNGQRLLDVGGGDGRTVFFMANRFTGLMAVHGVDCSPEMVENARQAQRQVAPDDARIRFDQGDVRQLADVCQDRTYDVVMSGRCLINLAGIDEQVRGVEQIAACVVPGGWYLAIENFLDGQNNMNSARLAIGLNEIPMRWHNHFFEPDQFRRITAPYFEWVERRHFASAYYYATRVIYSRYCQLRNEAVDYDHDMHRLAVELQPHGHFSPVQLVLLRRRCN